MKESQLIRSKKVKICL